MSDTPQTDWAVKQGWGKSELAEHLARPLEREIAQLKREKEEAEKAAAHVYDSLNEALRLRDATIKAAKALVDLMPNGEALRYFHAGAEVMQLRALLDKERKK